jgi:hypothetical protein
MMAEHRMEPESTMPEITGRAATTYRLWANANADAFR